MEFWSSKVGAMSHYWLDNLAGMIWRITGAEQQSSLLAQDTLQISWRKKRQGRGLLGFGSSLFEYDYYRIFSAALLALLVFFSMFPFYIPIGDDT